MNWLCVHIIMCVTQLLLPCVIAQGKERGRCKVLCAVRWWLIPERGHGPGGERVVGKPRVARQG